MNENLDLTKILKDCPKGTKLWSPVFGDCAFITIDLTTVIYPIKCQITTKDRRTTCIGFTKDGRLDIQYENGGCVLFPSKENMDWSTFVVPKKYKEFKPFEKVLRVDNEKIWTADFYSRYDKYEHLHYCTSGFIKKDDEIIPYAGNENKLGKKFDIKD